MDLRTMDDEAMDVSVRRTFGGKLPWDRKGGMCLVHLDRPGEALRRRRVAGFAATDLFDPACPHCLPILEDGAFVVFQGASLLGVHPLPDGRVELVKPRGPLRPPVAN